MKLVAATNFFNAPKLGLKVNPKDDGFVHPNMVHKGYRFILGGDAESLSGINDDTVRQQIATLVAYKMAVVDDGKPANNDAIKRIDAEVEAETTQAAALAEQASGPSLEERIATAVTAALAAAGVAKPKTA